MLPRLPAARYDTAASPEDIPPAQVAASFAETAAICVAVVVQLLLLLPARAPSAAPAQLAGAREGEAQADAGDGPSVLYLVQHPGETLAQLGAAFNLGAHQGARAGIQGAAILVALLASSLLRRWQAARCALAARPPLCAVCGCLSARSGCLVHARWAQQQQGGAGAQPRTAAVHGGCAA